MTRSTTEAPYYEDSYTKLDVIFADRSGTAVEPTIVELKIIAPDGTEYSYTKANGDLDFDATTKEYSYNFKWTSGGTWKYQWTGTTAASSLGEKEWHEVFVIAAI